ncbi:DUF222 domain-containing protein [Mycobacterium sp. MYCO198283]|uniref:DUF222 domain-containing protein n=1 Tax=Mycobacterium sp. MYCO198283 TaxID=2883505 RepID=UPI0035AB86DC
MSTATATFTGEVSPRERLDALFDELAELSGQRNAIDGRIVDIVAELERADLCGMTGARSVRRWWPGRRGATPRNAETMVAVARRLDEFPRCAEALREGRLSLIGWRSSPNTPPTDPMPTMRRWPRWPP